MNKETLCWNWRILEFAALKEYNALFYGVFGSSHFLHARGKTLSNIEKLCEKIDKEPTNVLQYQPDLLVPRWNMDATRIPREHEDDGITFEFQLLQRSLG